MKRNLILALLSAPALAFCATDPSPTPPASVSPTPPALTADALCGNLDQQSKILALAVQSKDTHTLHKLDAAVNQEIAGFVSAQGAALSVDQTKLLEDMGAQASAAHHDAHHQKWGDAAAAGAKFEADLKAVKETHLFKN